MLTILRNRTFAALFAAQVVALIGTGLLTVALGLLAYELAGADGGAVLGTALAIKMAAYVFVAPVITALIYRVPRRGWLLSSNAIRAGIALILPVVDQVWQIYVLIFLLQAASATFTPVLQSVIPAVLVDDKDYTRGLSLSRLAYDLESLLSPTLAAALLIVMPYNYLFLGTVAGFAASTAFVLAASVPALPAQAPTESFWERTTLGTRLMWQQPVLRSLLALNMAVASATALVVVNTVVYVHDILVASTDAAVAAMLACYGAGSMSVALAVPRLLTLTSDRRVMLTGAAIAAIGLTATTATLFVCTPVNAAWVLLGGLWFVLGAGTSLIITPSARLLRQHSDDDTRTAVFTAQFSLSHACFFLTYPLAGQLGAIAGQPAAATVLAILAAASLFLAARTWPHSHADFRHRRILATGCMCTRGRLP
ncbi:MAG: MFS transporter [Mycobacterium sp.]